MEKIKQFIENDTGKDILVVVIIVLVGLGSFQLGRLSKNTVNSGIKITYPDQEANAIESLNSDNYPNVLQKNLGLNLGNFFASSRGTKYYSLGCSAGKTIKEENRVYFTTSTEAQEAGYELSSSCR
ncbi:MAG: hypothetical protein UT09_C0002G0030 [Parcubacteria group bacterium GW2011_GWF2_38_8]|nr:MAG: hypothetical protein UT09_C0002G0030 [Parcubacteria group bacterium GW2011_GWF2_38_8]